jgi:hypothetical protein
LGVADPSKSGKFVEMPRYMYASPRYEAGAFTKHIEVGYKVPKAEHPDDANNDGGGGNKDRSETR